MITAHPESDTERLRITLRTDAVGAAYLLGDLDPPSMEHATWFVAEWKGRIIAVVLLYEGLAVPVVLSAGAPDGVAEVLERYAGEVPPEVYGKVPPGHRPGWEKHFKFVETDSLWVMGLDAGCFSPGARSEQVQRLDSACPAADLDAVYRDYPQHFFEPSQLESGIYYGAFVDGDLASVSGTHVFSPSTGVTVLGNIVTAQRHRGRGLATACSRRVIEEALDRGCDTIALQVAGTNRAAIASYRRLGFTYHSDVLQVRLGYRRNGRP